MAVCPREPLKRYGLKRLLRDIHQIAGQLTFDTPKHVCCIALNAAHPFARRLQPALTRLPAQEHTDVCLGEIRCKEGKRKHSEQQGEGNIVMICVAIHLSAKPGQEEAVQTLFQEYIKSV